MTSFPVCLALLEPLPKATSKSWVDPWKDQPLFLGILVIGVLLLLVVLGLKCQELPSRWRARGKTTLDPLQLEELMLGDPPQIIDLRTEQDFMGEQGHLRSAVNIPFNKLQKRLHELDTSHPRPIVLVDENDVLSHLAFPILAAQGHRWLYVLRGGMKGWHRARLPVYGAHKGKPKG